MFSKSIFQCYRKVEDPQIHFLNLANVLGLHFMVFALLMQFDNLNVAVIYGQFKWNIYVNLTQRFLNILIIKLSFNALVIHIEFSMNWNILQIKCLFNKIFNGILYSQHFRITSSREKSTENLLFMVDFHHFFFFSNDKYIHGKCISFC